MVKSARCCLVGPNPGNSLLSDRGLVSGPSCSRYFPRKIDTQQHYEKREIRGPCGSSSHIHEIRKF